MFGKKKKQQQEYGGDTSSTAIGLGEMLEEITNKHKRREAIVFENKTLSYSELDENANRVAGGLEALGIGQGDRVAMMLPNIPEFASTFFGIQKLGAVAVPFNTMYKGREISFILKDSGAKAIVCLSNFANLINEIKDECPELNHVIVTGQRTLVFIDPDATVNVQLVAEKENFESPDECFRKVGAILVDTFKAAGVEDAWYKHQGAVRAHGKKLATILVSEIENLYVVNVVAFLKDMDTEPLFKILWVPPEIKDKAVEPSTSIETEAGEAISLDAFRDLLTEQFTKHMGVTFEAGELTRDEQMAYEKNRALAGRM
ncbi:MAG: AMP-binding protein [Spirochaetales bacterium]